MSDRHTRIEPTVVPFPLSSLDKRGGPPDPPDVLGIRVLRLEEDVKGLRSDIAQIARDMNFLRGKVDQLPTTWTMIGTLTVGNAALLGLVFTMLKSFGVIK